MTSGAAQPSLPREVAGVVWGTPDELAGMMLRNAEKWAETAGVPRDRVQALIVLGPDRNLLEDLCRGVQRRIGGTDPATVQICRWLLARCDRQNPNSWT